MQSCIYDFLDHRTDPLFNKIKKIKKGESIVVSGYVISLTIFERYEIASEYTHEAYRTAYEAYQSLIVFLNDDQVNGF